MIKSYKFLFLLVLCCVWLYATNPVWANEPDSIYTREHVLHISASEPHRALRLIDEMETRKKQPAYLLNDSRSIVYQNGLAMYNSTLRYSLKA